MNPSVKAKTIFVRAEFEAEERLFLLTLKFDDTCRQARLADLSSGNRTIAVNNYTLEVGDDPQEQLNRAMAAMTQELAAYLSGDDQ